METHVFLAVLAAALCHASWNAAIKVRIDPAVAVTLIAAASGLVALPLLVLAPLPAAEALPFLAASTAIHLAYHLALAQAYSSGDLGQVYPIARGSAPLLTALTSGLVLGETLGAWRWLGVLVLTAGILLLSVRGGRDIGTFDARAAGFALATAVIIAAYTVVDGLGARAAGSAVSYVAWFFVLDAAMMAAWGYWRQYEPIRQALPRGWPIAFAGGALALASYGIALWAMTQAPIALVAAVRETSVLFAAVLGVLLLKEPFRPIRLLAAGFVLAGLVLIRLA